MVGVQNLGYFSYSILSIKAAACNPFCKVLSAALVYIISKYNRNPQGFYPRFLRLRPGEFISPQILGKADFLAPIFLPHIPAGRLVSIGRSFKPVPITRAADSKYVFAVHPIFKIFHRRAGGSAPITHRSLRSFQVNRNMGEQVLARIPLPAEAYVCLLQITNGLRIF